MNYSQSLEYLDSFTNLERMDWSSKDRHLNLDRMRALLQLFDHPEKSFRSIIIAGTKGKGSTGFFIESMLGAENIKTGFYNSPHLEDPRERIRLDCKMMIQKKWIAGIAEIKLRLQEKKIQFKPTYFELTTLLAAIKFKQEKVRVAILEVGMGGRLDATNVMGAKLVALTPIDFDHEAILGKTLSRIAVEKSAVIHEGSYVITAPQAKAAMTQIKKRVRQMRATLVMISKKTLESPGLEGDHQKINAAVAMKAVEYLAPCYGVKVSHGARLKGLRKINWPGRFEVMGTQPSIVLDAAHNPAAARALVATAKKYFGKKHKGVLVFGVSKDKKSEAMLEVLSEVCDTVLIVKIPQERSQVIEVLMTQARHYFKTIIPVVGNGVTAINLIERLALAKDYLLVTGSFYLVGEVRSVLKNG